MSFLPLNFQNLQPSLLGIGDPKLIDFDKADLSGKNIHGPKQHHATIIIIIISAIIFVTAVAIYDTIKSMINSHFTKLALINPDSHNTKKDIQRTLIANRESLTANCVFCIVCIILALVFVPILSLIYKAI